jgi:hypothetical protein
MPKFFDPVNHPKKAVNTITLYGNVITLDGGGAGTGNITINGILNTTLVTYATGYTETATAWVLANAAFYKTKGFVVTSSGAAISVTPLYEWDTVNRINAVFTSVATLTATTTTVFEPNLAIAKTWNVTLAHNTTVKYPKNAVHGDKIRIMFYNPSTYTVAWDVLGFFFIGGTEPTVTTTGYCVIEGVVNEDSYPKYDTMTLTGTSGTAYVTAGGLKTLMLWGVGGSEDLDETGEDFVTSFLDAYAAVGIALTEDTGVVTFTPTTKAAAFHTTSIKNYSGDLAGVVVTTRGGRIQCGYTPLDIKQ